MPSPWSAHILVLGGDAGEGEPTGGPFVLDLKTYTWSVLRCDGELPRGTVGHCSAAVDARVYVFGGFDPHSDHRAPAQARQIPRVPRLHAHVYRLQPNAIQAATLYTTQAYQNVLSVLSFDPQGQQLPRWEVLVSDAQAGQHRVKARRPGVAAAELAFCGSRSPLHTICTRRPFELESRATAVYGAACAVQPGT